MAKKKGKTKTKPTFENVQASIDKLAAAWARERRETKKALRRIEASIGALAAARAEGRRGAGEPVRDPSAEDRERDGTEEERRRAKQARRDATREVMRMHRDHIGRNPKWLGFFEDLLAGEFKDLLARRGIQAEGVWYGVGESGPAKTRREYDLVAEVRDADVVAEVVDGELTEEHVEDFLERLAEFREVISDQHGDKRVLGAVAFLVKPKPDLADDWYLGPEKPFDWDDPPDEPDVEGMDLAVARAVEAGLFVVRSPEGRSGTAELVNPPDFEPKEF